MRSRFSTANWVTFGTVFGVLGPSRRNPLEAFSAHVAIQRRPEVENLGFGRGLVAESVFEEFFVLFLEGSWAAKTLISHGRVAKITISPKSEFYHFLSPFWGSFWSQNLSKMALGLAMGRPG